MKLHRFMWSGSGSGDDNKLALVRWSLKTQPRQSGGLGIKIVGTMKVANGKKCEVDMEK